MSVTLVRLDVASEVSITRDVNGDNERRERVSQKALRAQLLLAPTQELRDVGFVHVHIEAAPEFMPDMTRAETKEWLCDVLMQLLDETPDGSE